MKPINKLLSTAALLYWASMALAGDPIPGVDVDLNKNPGGSVARVKSDANGNYHFSKLAPGNYDLCITGQACKTVVVGADRMLKGQVQKSTGKGASGPAKTRSDDANTALQGVSTAK